MAIVLTLMYDDHDDVAQEVMLQLVRCAGRFDPARGSWKTFVHTVARNRCIDLMRERSVRRSLRMSSLCDDMAEQEDDERLSEERLQALGSVKHLTPQQREVIRLVYERGLSICETAIVMQLGKCTVKSQMARAIRSMRSAAAAA